MASRSVNKVILLGHLGRDAETKFTPGGAGRTTFSLATNRSVKDQQTGEWKDETDWHNIVAWRQENITNYLTKGKQVYIEGRLQTRSYEDKDGKKVFFTEVVAENIILLATGTGRGDAAVAGADQPPVSAPRAPQRAPAPPRAEEPPADTGPLVTDDDVPF